MISAGSIQHNYTFYEADQPPTTTSDVPEEALDLLTDSPAAGGPFFLSQE